MQPRHEPLPDNERPPSTPPADRDWFGGRRWTGLGAVAVLLVIAICAAFLTWNHHGDQTPPPGSAHPTSAANPPPTSGLPDQQVPTTAPVSVTWTLYQSVALPYSAAAGPRHVDGDIATGYAHTPTGALIAAAQISTRSLLAMDSDWRQALEAMVAPGPGRDAYGAQRSEINHASPDPAGTYTQTAGFNFLSYSESDAVIQLVARSSDGTLQVTPLHMTWQGDWKLQLAPDGGDATSIQRVDNLAGFVPWSGV